MKCQTMGIAGKKTKNNTGSTGRKKSAGRARVGMEWKFKTTALRRDTAQEAILDAYTKYAKRKGPENVRIGAKTVMMRGIIKSSHVE